MYWPLSDYSLDNIFLDHENVRLPETLEAQDSIMHDLFSNENTMDIVKSIVQYGMFQDEFPILIKERKKLIVIEGNRRIAALKALMNPDRVPLFRDRILNLNWRSKIKDVRAVLAPNRDKARTLLAHKHTSVLRRPWKPLRQAYFYKSQIDNGKKIDQLIAEFPEQDIPKFMRMLEVHKVAKSISYESDEISNKVHDQRKFPITDLERMYQDETVANYLGIQFSSEGRLQIKTKIDEFKKAFRYIVSDIANEKLTSRNTNSKEERQSYITRLPLDLKPTISNTVTKSSDLKENKIEIKKERTKRATKGLIPSYIPFKMNNTSLRKIYNELRDIPVNEYPNAAHDLLRTFLECSLLCYLKGTKEFEKIQDNPKHYPSLRELLAFIKSENCTSITDPSLKQIVDQVMSDHTKPFSLERLNMINHNENWTSDETQVRTAWNKIEQLIKHIINPK